LLRRALLLGGGALAAGLASTPARSAAHGQTLQAFTENLPPLNFEQDGEAQGFSVELLHAITKDAELSAAVQVLPWQRAVQAAAATPASVLFSLTRTPERETQFAWLGPIAERRILIYQLASQPTRRLANLDELDGARIGVARESAAARALLAQGLEPGRHLELAADDRTNVRKLLAGRMEFLLLLDWAAAWHLRDLKLPYTTLRPVMEFDVGKSYWYGMPVGTDPALLTHLQTALDQIKRDGRYARLRQRYFT
jgi:polar amino acid transport system substrate-binding protein